MSVFRQAIAPVLAAYLAFAAMLAGFARSGRSTRRAPPAERSTRSVAGTFVGGFICFLVIVTVFYPILGNERPAIIWQALVQGLVLIVAIVIPGFMLLSALAAVSRRGRRARQATPPQETRSRKPPERVTNPLESRGVSLARRRVVLPLLRERRGIHARRSARR